MTSDSIDIKGTVCLPMRLRENTPVIRLDFYLASNFALLADGLLGLPSLRSLGMTVSPDYNFVQVFGKRLRATDQPVRLNCSWNRIPRRSADASVVPADRPLFSLFAISRN